MLICDRVVRKDYLTSTIIAHFAGRRHVNRYVQWNDTLKKNGHCFVANIKRKVLL